MEISKKISCFLCKEKIIKEEDVDICRYGIDYFLVAFLELLSILVISIFMRNFLQTIVYFISFIPLRMYAGGYHASTKLRCYTILVAVYFLFSAVLRFTPSNFILPLEIIIQILTFISVLIFAPIISDKKTVNQSEKKAYRKISITIMLIEFAVMVFGICLIPQNTYVFSFSLGQLSVALSMLMAIV